MRIYSLCVLCALALAPLAARAQAVWTYHNNNLRTGWNDSEQTLTVANVGGGTFGLLATTALDSQVDTQPLVIPKQTISGQGVHTVVYVATGNDTLYAIDGVTGTILLSRNFGTPVPQSALPGRCNNNAPVVGITSTPVIDTATRTMYLIADTYENNAAVFRVHAVGLSTLRDTITPVIITASARLADGTTYKFDANVSRQRAALLLSGGKLYAGFGSYCDQAADTSRGWLLGWNAANLAPLPHNQLSDRVPTFDSSQFLNSIWMSGYGPATGASDGNIYYLTSNSEATTYGAGNRDESLLQVSPGLNSIKGYFTDPKQATLDDRDEDFGSGGAMLSPAEPGENPRLLFAAGKSGTMYMFGLSASGAGLSLLNSYAVGRCWCGPSYFTAADSAGRVVTSGAEYLIIWKLGTSAIAPASLTQESVTAITTGQDRGFFTSISSDGTKPGTAVIWAVGRPTSAPGTMPLYAFDPATGDIIYTADAGNWNAGNADANTVPTVADGHVYVATNQELAIFGLGAPAAGIAPSVFADLARRQAPLPGFELETGQHAIWGTIKTVTDSELTLQTRTGAIIRVDLTLARQAGNVAAPVPGEAAVAIGIFAAGGVLDASHVEHAKSEPALWPRDQ